MSGDNIIASIVGLSFVVILFLIIDDYLLKQKTS